MLPLAEAENRPKSAHRYNVAEQQQIYKSEIERIWKAQFDSLSRKDEPKLTDEEKELQKKPITTGPSARPSPALSRAASVDLQRAGSLGPEENRKVLRIKRLVSTALTHINSHFGILRHRSMVFGGRKLFGTLQSLLHTYVVVS